MITNVLLGFILIINVFILMSNFNIDLTLDLIESDITSLRKHVFDIKLDNRWSRKVK